MKAGNSIRNKMKRIERTFYQTNNIPYYTVLLSIVINLYATIVLLNSLASTYLISVTILFNIFVTLFLFLCGIQVKVYRLNWAWILFGFIGFLILRTYIIYPMLYHTSGMTYSRLLIFNYLMIMFLLATNILTIVRIYNQRFYKKVMPKKTGEIHGRINH